MAITSLLSSFPLHHVIPATQCFANSDHLAVHLQKHELSLKFGSRQEVVMGKCVCFPHVEARLKY